MEDRVKNASAGNYGEGIRSDCHVEISLKDTGGIDLDLKSKVAVMFGKAIREQVLEMARFFRLQHAGIRIMDSGALPFVIAARLEAAIKKLITSSNDYLLPELKENKQATPKDRKRISRLYIPGNAPHLMINAGIHKPDGIIFDLEDAVAPDKKYEARFLVRNALRNLNLYGAEKMVRVNQFPKSLDDLDHIVPHFINLILVPKCESKEEILEINQKLASLNPAHRVWLMPIIESALGIIHSFEIATAADNIAAMAIGLEDYTADLGIQRTSTGKESFYARSHIVNACKAARIQAIDSVYSDVANTEGLKETVLESKSLGFDGMGCIHPRQIAIIHEHFAPSSGELEKAKKIFLAFREASEKGLGVVSLGTKMIDPPVVKQAKYTIDMAVSRGMLPENWLKEEKQ